MAHIYIRADAGGEELGGGLPIWCEVEGNCSVRRLKLNCDTSSKADGSKLGVAGISRRG